MIPFSSLSFIPLERLENLEFWWKFVHILIPAVILAAAVISMRRRS